MIQLTLFCHFSIFVPDKGVFRNCLTLYCIQASYNSHKNSNSFFSFFLSTAVNERLIHVYMLINYFKSSQLVCITSLKTIHLVMIDCNTIISRVRVKQLMRQVEIIRIIATHTKNVSYYFNSYKSFYINKTQIIFFCITKKTSH